LVHEDFVSHGSTSNSSSRKRSSPQDIGSARYRTDNSPDDFDTDYSYRDYSFDRHRHRSRR
jgi:zinc finger CCHC domain-containing protein 8